MMYEDLINKLRELPHLLFVQLGEHKDVVYQAADAIEELTVQIRNKNVMLAEAINERPQWIPVTERLPEDGEFVLVCNDDGHMMIAKHETETYEWYYKYTNYDIDIWDNEEQGPVCYWMPLPKQPTQKEKT